MCCINFYALHFKTEMGNSLIAIFCNSFIRIILQLRNMFNYENNSKKIFMSLYNCLKNCLNLQKTYTHKKEFVKEIFSLCQCHKRTYNYLYATLLFCCIVYIYKKRNKLKT